MEPHLSFYYITGLLLEYIYYIICLLLAFLIWMIIKKFMQVKQRGNELIIGEGDAVVSDGRNTPDSNDDDPVNEKLTFHHRFGRNIAILNEGQTVQKINMKDPLNAVVFTNRALKDNEMFEMKLLQKRNRSGNCMGIGVITTIPENVEILPAMWKSPVAWMWHHDSIYNNKEVILRNYTEKNMDKLEVGDKVGVMRKDSGKIHFYLNGEDQGPAVSGIPSPVYGLFELWHDAMKASIVNHPK